MKRRKTAKDLTPEDRSLWKQVAETITPLSKPRGQTLKDEMNDLMNQVTSPAVMPVAPKPTGAKVKHQALNYQIPSYSPPTQHGHSASHPIEERVLKKLGKGKLSIDSRIDLHGMTQDRARFALLDFLQMAQHVDHRIVLVITGKGNEGRGILRNAVPEWLKLPQFSQLVNGTRSAHATHGGDGALYVRIRKPSIGRRSK